MRERDKCPVCKQVPCAGLCPKRRERERGVPPPPPPNTRPRGQAVASSSPAPANVVEMLSRHEYEPRLGPLFPKEMYFWPVSPFAFRVAAQIHYYTHGRRKWDGNLFSERQLAEQCHMSRGAVRDAIAELEQAGRAIVERTPGHRTRLRLLLQEEEEEERAVAQ